MVKLLSDIEKQLWRDAALSALRMVEDVSAKEDKEATKFATAVADALILSYRKRVEV